MSILQLKINGVVVPFEVVDPTTTPPDVPPVIPPVEPPGTTTPDPAFMAGANDFHWIPVQLLAIFKTVRQYIASGWVWRPGGLFVQPLFQAETATVHGLDDHFAAAVAAGIDIVPCINKVPDWYAGVSDGSGSNNWPPIKPGKNRTDPASYADVADFWFQFCARYGSKTHPPELLRVDTTASYPNQPQNIKKSGLKLIRTVEINNELDRWWDRGGANDLAYMKPEEHAAMLWACYDACKRADPNMRVVMGGLTGFDLPYLKAMKAYFDAKGVPFKSDKINVHHYSNVRNEAGVWPPTWVNDGGCSPAEDKDFATISKVVAFAKTIGLKVWVTEFGCDSKGPSWMHIVGKNGETDEVAQGRVIVETFEAYRKAGVERAYVFEMAEEPGEKNGGLWQTCGLVNSQAEGFTPKPAYDAVKNYLKTLPV